MNYKLFTLLFCMIFFASAVHATVTAPYTVRLGIFEPDGSFTATTNSISGVHARAFNCIVAGCSFVNQNPFQEVYSPSSIVTLTFPTQLQQHGYAAYFFKDGYIGWEQSGITLAGTGTAESEIIYLSRVRRGHAPIINFSVYNQPYNEVEIQRPIRFGVDVGIDAVTQSVLVNAQETNIPIEESLNIRATVEIRNAQNAIIYTDIKDITIGYSALSRGYAPIEFTFSPGFASVGEYTVILRTRINDHKVMQQPESSASFTIRVIDPADRNYSYTVLQSLTCPNPNVVGNIATVSFNHFSNYVTPQDTLVPLDTNLRFMLERNGNIIHDNTFRRSSDITFTSYSFDITQGGNYRILIEASPVNPQGTYVLMYDAECIFSRGNVPPRFTRIPDDESIPYLQLWNGVRFEAEDESGIVRFSVTDSRFRITNGLLEWNQKLPVGVYPVEVIAQNAQGLTSSVIFTLTVEKITPSLQIQGETLVEFGDSITIRGIGCPDSELRCTLRRDGIIVPNPDRPVRLLPGRYVYTYSTPGNNNYFAHEVSHVLTVVSVPLVLNIQTPREGQNFIESTVPVIYEISGGVPGYSCIHLLYEGQNNIARYAGCNNFAWHNLLTGQYTMVSEVVDAIGETVSLRRSFTVTIPDPFSINLATTVDDLDATFAITANKQMTQCVFMFEDGTTDTVVITPASNTLTQMYTFAAGTHTVGVDCTDVNGDRDTASTTFVTTDPVIPFNIQLSTTVNDLDATFAITANKQMTQCVFMFEDGTTDTVVITPASNTLTQTYTFSAGTHTVGVDCTDVNGDRDTASTTFVTTAPLTPFNIDTSIQIVQDSVTFNIRANKNMSQCTFIFEDGSQDIVSIVPESQTLLRTYQFATGRTHRVEIVCISGMQHARRNLMFTLDRPRADDPDPDGRSIRIINFDIHDNNHLRIGQQDLNLRFKNIGRVELRNVVVQASIPELGVWTRTGPVTIRPGQEINRLLLLDIHDADPGFYYLRLTFTGNDYTRAVWYEIYIE